MKRVIGTMGVLVGIASLLAGGAQTNGNFSLTVRLRGHYDPTLTVCTLIRTAEPFEVMLTNGKTKTILSGKLQRPKKQIFPLELAIAQGDRDHVVFDRGVYQLELGVAVKRPVIVETSNHPSNNPTVEDREITLANSDCPSLSDDVSK